MLTKQQAEDKLIERGFFINAYGNDNDGNTNVIYATTNPLEDCSYGCDVFLNTEEFQLKYVVPRSINALQTPKCGSFMNDDHFTRIQKKFAPQVEALHKAQSTW